MPTYNEVRARFLQRARSKGASTYFVNGAPRSGLSTCLVRLADDVRVNLPHAIILGPYHVRPGSEADLYIHLLEDCRAAALIETLPTPAHTVPDYPAACRWLERHIQLGSPKSLVVLLDVGALVPDDLRSIGTLFSALRYQEGAWHSPQLRLHHVLVGCWDHSALERYFVRIDTSFPYTVGQNYVQWDGLSPDEMTEQVRSIGSVQNTDLHGRLLHEITSGHPGATADIIRGIPLGAISLGTLLSATRAAAADGDTARTLVDYWRNISPQGRGLLKRLIEKRHVSTVAAETSYEFLLSSGIARLNILDNAKYLSLRSWYVELLVRLHLGDFGLNASELGITSLPLLVPEVNEINRAAYQVISDTENAARNFVALQLLSSHVSPDTLLVGRAKRIDRATGIVEDLHQRAQDWRARSAAKGLPAEPNPLLAYCTTTELADLIDEIATGMASRSWRRIASFMRELGDVRDAVMHNQLIDEEGLARLSELQSAIYSALNE